MGKRILESLLGSRFEISDLSDFKDPLNYNEFINSWGIILEINKIKLIEYPEFNVSKKLNEEIRLAYKEIVK